jgi:outer membrane immunogenic protein
VTSGADLGAFAAVSVRLGLILDTSWLAYTRAGLVVAELDATTVQTCTGVDLCGGAQSTTVSSATTDDLSLGLLLGAGVEHKFTHNWSGRLEYQFMSFRRELARPAIDGPGWNHDVDVHALKLGLSYRF